MRSCRPVSHPLKSRPAPCFNQPMAIQGIARVRRALLFPPEKSCWNHAACSTSFRPSGPASSTFSTRECDRHGWCRHHEACADSLRLADGSGQWTIGSFTWDDLEASLGEPKGEKADLLWANRPCHSIGHSRKHFEGLSHGTGGHCAGKCGLNFSVQLPVSHHRLNGSHPTPAMGQHWKRTRQHIARSGRNPRDPLEPSGLISSEQAAKTSPSGKERLCATACSPPRTGCNRCPSARKDRRSPGIPAIEAQLTLDSDGRRDLGFRRPPSVTCHGGSAGVRTVHDISEFGRESLNP